MQGVEHFEFEGASSLVEVKIEPLEEHLNDEEVPGPSTADPLSELLDSNGCEAECPLVLDDRDATMHPDGSLLRCLHCHRDVTPPCLTHHMVTQHGYRSVRFKCQTCDATFVTRDELSQHRAKRHKPPIVSCEICRAKVQSNYLYKHIQKVHSIRNIYQRCELCHKHLKSKETLREHVKAVHSEEEESDCLLCGQTFKSKKYLLNHVRNVHPTPDKALSCTECGKVFKSRMCLHQHMKNVHAPRAAAAACPICPKVFKSKANLSQHMKHMHPDAAPPPPAAASTTAPVPLHDLPRQLLDRVGLSTLYQAAG